MSVTGQIAIVLTALRDTLGPLNPWLVALWLACTISLACLLVISWQRLLQR